MIETYKDIEDSLWVQETEIYKKNHSILLIQMKDPFH